MILPGLYLAMTNFHTQLLPTKLLLSFAAARQGVPFPGVVEVLLMELSFELLREAGVRLPGAMGNTIGIVGGLIIGQAAVDAPRGARRLDPDALGKEPEAAAGALNR